MCFIFQHNASFVAPLLCSLWWNWLIYGFVILMKVSYTSIIMPFLDKCVCFYYVGFIYKYSSLCPLWIKSKWFCFVLLLFLRCFIRKQFETTCWWVCVRVSQCDGKRECGRTLCNNLVLSLSQDLSVISCRECQFERGDGGKLENEEGGGGGIMKLNCKHLCE